MSERATPETDEWVYQWSLVDIADDEHPDYIQDFARKIERERDEARQDLADYKAHAEKVRETISKALLNSVEERDKLLILVGELRDALQSTLTSLVGRMVIKDTDTVEIAHAALTKAKEVLP